MSRKGKCWVSGKQKERNSQTRSQHCRVHKTSVILNKLPKLCQEKQNNISMISGWWKLGEMQRERSIYSLKPMDSSTTSRPAP
jgi:hypothetical protein